MNLEFRLQRASLSHICDFSGVEIGDEKSGSLLIEAPSHRTSLLSDALKLANLMAFQLHFARQS
jgi:hypothetical protein